MTSATTDRRQGLVGNTSVKAPATVLAAGNITLSGQQTIDGVAVLAINSAGVPDRVLCIGQTNPIDNGIWDVSTASWTRSMDANGNYDLTQGTIVQVYGGSVSNAGSFWSLTSSGTITIGTTALTWAKSFVPTIATLGLSNTVDYTLGVSLVGGAGRVIDTIAILRTLPKTGSPRAFVTGYYAAGDGGGGLYYYDSTDVASLDNGGTIIVAGDGGRWKLSQVFPVSVKQFGAKGDGATDDTAAIQAAITATPAAVLLFPAGTFVFSTLSVSTGMSFRGAARDATILRTSSATADAIVCATTASVEFSNMTIGATVVRSAGSYVKIAPAASYNGESLFREVDFQGGFNAIFFSAAATWRVLNCALQSFTNVGITVQNTATPDAGDSAIWGCTFNGAAGSTAINQFSSGGLRISNNKFLSGAYHYAGSFSSGASGTSILILEGNSSEGATTANFSLNSSASTAFSKVLIRDNQMSVLSGATGMTVQDPGYVWLDDVNIGGNNMSMGGGAGVAINIARCTRLSLDSNQIVGNNLETGIIIGANVTNAIIAPQDLTSLLTPWSGAGLASATFSPGRKESGSVTAAAASTVYGPIFAGATVTVSFAQAYGKAPDVKANATASGGGIAVLISSITTTGFNYTVLTVTNGGVVTFNWEAHG